MNTDIIASIIDVLIFGYLMYLANAVASKPFGNYDAASGDNILVKLKKWFARRLQKQLFKFAKVTIEHNTGSGMDSYKYNGSYIAQSAVEEKIQKSKLEAIGFLGFILLILLILNFM